MAREFARKFYKSRAWQECRRSFISSRQSVDGGLCQHCTDSLGYIVDHIIELAPSNINDVQITLNHENLQYLCTKCHNTKTFGNGSALRDDVMFDSNGQVVRKL